MVMVIGVVLFRQGLMYRTSVTFLANLLDPICQLRPQSVHLQFVVLGRLGGCVAGEPQCVGCPTVR